MIVHASSTSSTEPPPGTGTPIDSSSCLVSSLSCAIDSAIALVASTSAAWIRRWWTPQPNCTRLPSVRRRNGMPRATAADTIAPVLGPRRMSSSSSRSFASAAAVSYGASARAASTSAPADSSASRPTASCEYSNTIRVMPGSRVGASPTHRTG